MTNLNKIDLIEGLLIEYAANCHDIEEIEQLFKVENKEKVMQIFAEFDNEYHSINCGPDGPTKKQNKKMDKLSRSTAEKLLQFIK